MTVETGRLLARPIFVVGVPRAGTTMLYSLLTAAPEVFSLRAEGRFIWRMPETKPFAPEARGWDSGVLRAEDAAPALAAVLERAYYVAAVPNWSQFEARLAAGSDREEIRRQLVAYLKERNVVLRKRRNDKKGSLRSFHVEADHPMERALQDLKEAYRPLRFVDKTPANCLRVGFLNVLFPDALFIFLKRDGPGNVNSLMEGWKVEAAKPAPVARGYALPVPVTIPGLPGDGPQEWRYILPPGWRAYVDRPLEEVATFQWMECNRLCLESLTQVDPARVYALWYHELVEATEEQLRRIYDFAGLRFDGRVRAMVRNPPVVAAHTPPEKDKWKRQNGPAIERMLPRMLPLMRQLGYDEL